MEMVRLTNGIDRFNMVYTRDLQRDILIVRSMRSIECAFCNIRLRDGMFETTVSINYNEKCNAVDAAKLYMYETKKGAEFLIDGKGKSLDLCLKLAKAITNGVYSNVVQIQKKKWATFTSNCEKSLKRYSKKLPPPVGEAISLYF